MEIGNINGSNAYTANSPTQTAGSASLENKRTPLPEDTQKPERSPSSGQAFQVNITQEAQNMLAAQSAPPVQTAPSDNDSDDGMSQRPDGAQQARQIVNIVA